MPALEWSQVQVLAKKYGLTEKDAYIIEHLWAMVGGHPYLLSLAFYHFSVGNIDLNLFLNTAATPTGIYSEHLLSLLIMLREHPELASAMQKVVQATESVPLNAIASDQLESLGLVTREGHSAKPSCQLYRLYFKEQLPLL